MPTEINRRMAELLRDPRLHSETLELTPEKKAQFKQLAHQIIDLLKANLESPIEGYMILQLIMDSFEANYGIAGAFAIKDDDHQ